MTVADDLVARIRTALDETERVALAAGGVAWVADDRRMDLGYVEEAATGEVVVYDEGRPSAEQAQHIALHDPERELRMVAAHRKMLDECAYEIRDAERRDTGDGLGLAETMVSLLAEAYDIEP